MQNHTVPAVVMIWDGPPLTLVVILFPAESFHPLFPGLMKSEDSPVHYELGFL